jgi:hypothetical protein
MDQYGKWCTFLHPIVELLEYEFIVFRILQIYLHVRHKISHSFTKIRMIIPENINKLRNDYIIIQMAENSKTSTYQVHTSHVIFVVRTPNI